MTADDVEENGRGMMWTTPPTIGAAIRFITSAPVPLDHMIGNGNRLANDTLIGVGQPHGHSCRTDKVEIVDFGVL